MGTFLKKDMLVLVRDKTELTILLAMPFILMVILGFALRGLLGGDTEALHMPVAVVQLDDEQRGTEQFVDELDSIGLPPEVMAELEMTAAELRPYSLLENILTSDNMSDMLEPVLLDASEAEQALKNGEVAAVLTVPENFTYHALQKMLLDIGSGSELHISVSEYGSLSASLFHEIIDRFVHTLNFETAVSKASGDMATTSAEQEEMAAAADIGGIETVSAREPVSSFQYYTIAMAVMFVLYVATAIGQKAYVERQQHVFSRILLSDRHPLAYLGGKFVSATVIAFCQIVILFVLSSLIFRSFASETVAFWFGMAVISFVLSICVGGVAALLTSLTIRFNNNAVTIVFSAGIVSLLAFVGGSFMPVSEMAEFLGVIGRWTPNGAALSAYIQWMQGADAKLLLEPMTRIAVIAVVLLSASVFIFPRRRSI
ncbi:ABC-2 type transport system permease protein [Evansella caseinilytica]|uniref:ABC-2 type transport system permease protein n=1 Tax=Evansella caseinilytica TaxID=1503961 RepID=A0A1H3STB3_9BACI|nr:ABC transporter permease [Evansella caseinilytica]SDZ40957.1 ABC-2 type transport system permease protein [Evansella caseinilytica]